MTHQPCTTHCGLSGDRCECLKAFLAKQAGTDLDRFKAAADALELALQQIAELKERPANLYPADWREQIAACPECQRYKDHPIQQGICDDHRRPIYKSRDHDAHEARILGYRCQTIARNALTEYRAALASITDTGGRKDDA